MKVKIKVDQMKLKMNERELAAVMGEAVRVELAKRLASGLGAQGPLPKTKDSNTPMRRTGTLAASVAVGLREKKDEVFSIVRSFGNRPAKERANWKSFNAAVRTQMARQALIDEHVASLVTGSVFSRPDLLRKKPTKTGKMLKLGKIKVRAGDTNAAVAAILSQPPKDPNGVKGNRGQYRVFEYSPEYRRAALDAAKNTIRVELVATGKQVER